MEAFINLYNKDRERKRKFMANINTILFDFDGTLMDTNNVIIQSWQHTFRTLEGKERDVAEIISTFGEPLADTMKKFFPDRPLDETTEVYRSYHYDNFTDLIDIFPGIIDLLKELKKNGYKTAVVTSRLMRTTKSGMDKFDLNQYFDEVITCDHTEKHKPDPEPIEIALAKLQAKPEEALMLGDTMFDILCAKNAGVKSVLVGWALAVTEDEKSGSNAPDFIIEKPEEIFTVIERIGGREDV